ncbi:YwqI/YxiC family protein [Bacillus sp. YC2]|uniref:YwqI/YxiC family protein n=1 Tax=Bacillus sp. YC2 TaxID=2861287 RepID=UPI001CA6599F|nr:YwqI/YxiC family protein [Bacillus sp. YC2]MBY8911650.1 YwqI/YxiC family protein [Bacillus sp. YC2]
MAEIKLKYGAVIKQLEAVSRALEAVSIAGPGSNGKNKLDYTSKFQSREAKLHSMIGEYKQAVHKNIADVKDNVDSLKEQDEAIAVK